MKRVRILSPAHVAILSAAVALLACDTTDGDPTTDPNDALDITNVILTNRTANCADYVEAYKSSATDIATTIAYTGSLVVTESAGTCVFTSNAVPNHDFNDAGGFVNSFTTQMQAYTVTATPQANAEPTALSLTYDNAVMLNGIKLDLLAAGCFGVGDGFIGCNDISAPWRFDPMSPNANFGTDSHNAHTQPNGGYHYHGNPKALFNDGDASVASPVIGFAADGFPIYGSFFDDNGTIRKALSSYKLKDGDRPTAAGSPGGTYDGRT